MTLYRVTATLSQRQLIDYLDANGSVDVQIQAIEDNPQTRLTEAPPAVSRPRQTTRKVRAKRGSKVVETILEALGRGHADAAELKKALEKAGLSPNSLSTGLAILQKDGRIVRGGGEVPYGEGDGVAGSYYELAA